MDNVKFALAVVGAYGKVTRFINKQETIMAIIGHLCNAEHVMINRKENNYEIFK